MTPLFLLVLYADPMADPQRLAQTSPFADITDDARICYQQLCQNENGPIDFMEKNIHKFLANESYIEEFDNKRDFYLFYVRQIRNSYLSKVRYFQNIISMPDFNIATSKLFEEIDALLFIIVGVQGITCDNSKDLNERLTLLFDNKFLNLRSDPYKAEVAKVIEYTRSHYEGFGPILAQCNFYREEEYDQVFADRLEKLKIFLKDDKVSVLSDDTRTYSLAETKDLVQELEKLKGQIDLSSLTRILHLTHFEHDLLPSCLGQCREIVLNEWANKDRILYLLNTLLTQLQNLNETEKLRDIRMVELSRHLHHKYLMDAQAKIIASVEEYKENLSNFFPKDKNSLWNYLNSINYSFNNTLIPQFISQQHNTLSSDLKLPAFLIGLSSSPESTTANIAIMYSMLQRSFNDAYNFNDNTITVSLFSLFFGPDIIFHELAHSIETYFISDSASNDFRQRLSAISNCVAQLHTGYGHQYLDEDMADTISAYFGNTAFSPHCQMFDQITLTLSPSPQDTHSSDFFRLIYTNFIKGNYPPSCKRVVESDPGHHMKKCI